MRSLWALLTVAGYTVAQCPFAGNMAASIPMDLPLYTNDTDVYMTTDWGTPIQDQLSLKVGPRGPTVLEDFMFRQKLQRFDHERIPERVVHARGVGAYGTFTSYADWSNITAASFLSAEGKQTETFVRFSTVQGFRGSPDTVRDMHGFATRFYTDEGNYDVVGVTVPVFFIQDASQFPDLVHAIKPEPQTEIPQGGTAHTTAYDFFSSQASSLHTLLWFMAGHGIPRSFRHVDGFGVHAFRFVNATGNSVYVKIHFRSLQGVAGMVWEEAQAVAGKNFDYHRQDLYNAIDRGHFPEYEFGVQIVQESDALAYGFDIIDPTKFIPLDVVPVTWLGKMQLNRNVVNYFAETEQIGFQPGHVVRGIDFSEDPLLQGRLYSYLDTQLQRHGSANFEQLPINRPKIPVHNNNRDGFMQSTIPTNQYAYTPNTLNYGSPMQANQTVGDGFFTSPNRFYSGDLVRQQSSTFNDFYTQPRLFWNSLSPEEQQMVVNGLRFEVSHVPETSVRHNLVTQLNRIDNDLACRVAAALAIVCPAPDPTYYHNNKTIGVSTFNPLYNISGLQIAFLASEASPASLSQGMQLSESLASAQIDVTVVAESLQNANATYSATDGSMYDAIIVANDIQALFSESSFTMQPNSTSDMPKTVSPASSLFPAGRPLQILVDAFKYGKTVGALGSGSQALKSAGISSTRPGVYVAENINANFVKDIESGLTTFKWLDRFTLDSN
ncbi:catalase-like domain-containing protein [Talaromyces proteolyticus]|uniref:Catalase n=1 Tax=Talaromyces proteolyticus TaxID=1131652 RepID=A0AAD4PTP9_9EURO|nr:catalase-like domain-containing protein [Talaromyces proteolyticus]KAH8691205.1 catalase-like domain-containing protein [Talaromyces proteolyticus]